MFAYVYGNVPPSPLEVGARGRGSARAAYAKAPYQFSGNVGGRRGHKNYKI